MLDLRQMPSQHDRAAWPDYLDAVDAFAAKPEISIQELALGGELFNRLTPIMTGWGQELDRINQGRLRGISGSNRDEELERLYSRLAGIVGLLREFAAFTNSGSVEFPETMAHNQLAESLLAADLKEKARVKAAEEAAKPKPEWRWTARGYFKNDEA